MINSKRLDIHDYLKIEGDLLNRKPIKQIAQRLGKSLLMFVIGVINEQLAN